MCGLISNCYDSKKQLCTEQAKCSTAGAARLSKPREKPINCLTYQLCSNGSSAVASNVFCRKYVDDGLPSVTPPPQPLLPPPYTLVSCGRGRCCDRNSLLVRAIVLFARAHAAGLPVFINMRLPQKGVLPKSVRTGKKKPRL